MEQAAKTSVPAAAMFFFGILMDIENALTSV
jgi:hypothetical protein